MRARWIRILTALLVLGVPGCQKRAQPPATTEHAVEFSHAGGHALGLAGNHVGQVAYLGGIGITGISSKA